MSNPAKSFSEIENEIARNQEALSRIRAARQASKGYLSEPSPRFRARIEAVPAAERKRFNLLAQGDSWFDYFPGRDLIRCLHEDHGHVFSGADGSSTNLAVAGSTLNDEAYGPVPADYLGILQSNDVSRIAELVDCIKSATPQALLLSAGGNDVAGDEFFSFIENARSGLPPVNPDVLQGVLNRSFRSAFEYIIDNASSAAGSRSMPIFIHGYDYPWPDGRGVLNFLGWKVGPWFDASFNHKNYTLEDDGLKVRHDIVKQFIDALNGLIKDLAAKYPGKVFHIDLRGTLSSRDDWANELHPGNDGFASLANKIDDALQATIQ